MGRPAVLPAALPAVSSWKAGVGSPAASGHAGGQTTPISEGPQEETRNHTHPTCPHKVNLKSAPWPAVPRLGRHLGTASTPVHTRTCAQTSTHGGVVNKTWPKHRTESHPASKRKEILTCAPTWTHLEDSMLGDRCHHGKILWLLLQEVPGAVNPQTQEVDGGRQGCGRECQLIWGFIWGWQHVLGLDRGDVTQPCERPKCHEVVHLQMVILCHVNVTPIRKP